MEVFYYIKGKIYIALALIIVTRKRKTFYLPKTFFGRKLVTDQNKKAKRKRMITSYLPEAIIFALGMTLASILASGYISFAVSIVEFIFYFVFSYIFDYAWGEFNVKGYNQSLEE